MSLDHPRRPYSEPVEVGPGVGRAERSLVETTELRWFAEGALPSDVVSWFTCSGTRGVVEQRCDVYRIDGRPDVGVKLRSRRTLEVKVRRSGGRRMVLDDGPQGVMEVWRKRRPAEESIDLGQREPWVEVEKRIVKRRFMVGGDEVALSSVAPLTTEAACDVEIVAISVGDIRAWSFAFAACGPTRNRDRNITASWRSLALTERFPDRDLARLGPSSGYPEWLERAIPHGVVR